MTIQFKRAIDGSNWSGGSGSVFVPSVGNIAVPTVEELQRVRALGFERLIVSCVFTPVTRAWLAAGAAAGFELQAYRYLNFPGGPYGGESAADQVRRSLTMCEGYDVRLMWLDAEDDGNTLSQGDTVAFIQEAADACAGRMYSGIYTAPSWWIKNTGNSPAFAGFPWWDATNSKNPEAVPPLYAGKTGFDMVQYDFDGEPVRGLMVDLNVYGFNVPDATPPTAPAWAVAAAATQDAPAPAAVIDLHDAAMRLRGIATEIEQAA